MSLRAAALIPAFREEREIARVVRAAREQVDLVLVVDDGSDDRTADRAREAGAEVIAHPANRGKGAAIKTGLRALDARGVEWVVLLDGDGQHDPGEIGRFLAAIGQGDRVLAVGNRMRDLSAMPWIRRVTNRVMSATISRLCGQPIPDSQCGFRMLPRAAIPVVDCPTDRFDYETEMLIVASRAGFRVVPVPVSTIYAGEKSKIHPVRDTLNFIRLVRRYSGRSARP